jgi:hypothetical protein
MHSKRKSAALAGTCGFFSAGSGTRIAKLITGILYLMTDVPMIFPIHILVVALLNLALVICFALVVVKMIQAGEQSMGIACIILLFVCGIGGLVAFVYGWMNATKWGIKNIMWIWTGVIVAGVLLVALPQILMLSAGPGDPTP